MCSIGLSHCAINDVMEEIDKCNQKHNEKYILKLR